MDALRAAFESQFGTEWSTPVVGSTADSEDASAGERDANHSDSDYDNDNDLDNERDGSELALKDPEDVAPVTVRHTDIKDAAQPPLMTKAQRRKFMNSGAPLDDTAVEISSENTTESNEDLQNDLALQRLIEESHILSERPKGDSFSGADISGAADPMEMVSKNRLKIMEARLAKAGAKTSRQRMPQAMSVGMREKAAERKQRQKTEAREAGIILAKERHTKGKSRTRDKGLKINTVGRASEHGIHISAAEISRLTGKRRDGAGRRRK